MPRKYSQEGPVARALELVGERWTLLLLQEMLKGVKRFSDLSERVKGISPNILSARLKTLEENSIIARKFYSLHPPRAEYHLTKKGHDLGLVAGALAVWGAKYFKDDIKLVHKICENNLDVIYHCDQCLIPVRRSDVRLKRN